MKMSLSHDNDVTLPKREYLYRLFLFVVFILGYGSLLSQPKALSFDVQFVNESAVIGAGGSSSSRHEFETMYTALMSMEDNPETFNNMTTDEAKNLQANSTTGNESKVVDPSSLTPTSHDYQTTIDTADMTIDPKETLPNNDDSWIQDFQTTYTPNITIYDPTTWSNKHYNASWIPSYDWLLNCTIDMNATATIKGEWKNGLEMALGDCIKFCACYPITHGNQSFNGMYHARNCKNKTDPKLVNLESIDIIHEIQSHKPGFDIPEPNAIVIHLRLGDIVETSRATPLQMLVEGANPGHKARNFPKALKSVAELLENIRTAGVDKVHIVGGSHKPFYYFKSRIYAGCIEKSIQAAGYNVTTRLEGIPAEQDFFFASHAKYLVVSAGGYSNLIGALVGHRNGTIVGRSFGLYWR